MVEECVIIGGGVAGLSAANQLADTGKSPLIIEGGNYPCHRICGEYFSHESKQILDKWKISLTGRVTKIQLIKEGNKTTFTLPIQAGSASHFIFDETLAKRAVKKGARLFCQTSVVSIQIPTKEQDPYQVILSTGQEIKACHLIIGTGKLPKISGIESKISQMKYFGFKAHFEGVEIDDALEMYPLLGGYVGLVKIDEKTTNIAGLINVKHADLFPDVLADSFFYKRLFGSNMLFPKWLSCKVPEFGIRKNPKLKNVFWIGDAAGAIPPISGQGLAVAITSGCMAADYLLQGREDFQESWLKRYQARYFWANCFHQAMQRTWMHPAAIKLFSFFPSLPTAMWRLTREKGAKEDVLIAQE